MGYYSFNSRKRKTLQQRVAELEKKVKPLRRKFYTASFKSKLFRHKRW